MTEPAYSMEFNGATESEVTVTPLVEPTPVVEYKQPGHWELYLPQVRSLGFWLISEGWTLMQEGEGKYYYYYGVIVGNEKDHVKVGISVISERIGEPSLLLMSRCENQVWVKLLFALVQGRPADPTPALPEMASEPEPVPAPVMPKKHYHLWDALHQEVATYNTKKEALQGRSHHVSDQNSDREVGERRVGNGDYEIEFCLQACTLFVQEEQAPEPDRDPMHHHLYDVHRQQIGIYRTRTEAMEARGNHLVGENTDKDDDDRLALVGDYEIAVCHRGCFLTGEEPNAEA